MAILFTSLGEGIDKLSLVIKLSNWWELELLCSCRSQKIWIIDPDSMVSPCLIKGIFKSLSFWFSKIIFSRSLGTHLGVFTYSFGSKLSLATVSFVVGTEIHQNTIASFHRGSVWVYSQSRWRFLDWAKFKICFLN